MRVLIVKLSSLGDVVHAMPAVQDIRAALPHARIDWVVERGFSGLVERCEGVVGVIPCELRRWRRAPLSRETRQGWRAFRTALRAQAYDAVIDLQGLSKSALVAWTARLAPGGRRYALANRTEGSSYEAPTRWVAHEAVRVARHVHAVERSRALCASALGYAQAGPAVFGLRAQQGAGLAADEVALVHGTSRDDKLWPEAHWVALGRRLSASGLRIGLPHGSVAEQDRAGRLAQALGKQASVWPRLDLGSLSDRIAGCAGVVGVDSGLSHIATALDRPHVQIYNFDTAWRTGPCGSARQRAVFAAPTPSVEAVWSAWEQVRAAP
ncbi:lipopolysaccharide heptosyltransferase I [Ramlibacter sp. AN1015]|uniref:lipopolysaccharide heptosyltransferase I n=1 Tax=Ramlibacter sp. AN1015 TaxID=3133428 RepID=UPI0030BB822A